MGKALYREAGFTLIELLIVMGMLGIVITAVYSLYLTHQRSAYTQDEVVEVQQNVRIAMDSITRDIRNAGTLIPRTDNPATPSNVNVENSPVGNAGPNSITLNMASSQEGYAWVTADLAAPTTDFSLSVDSLGNFNPGDHVRIIRPELMTEATGTVGSLYTVTSIAGTVMNLHYVAASGIQPSASTPFKRGDVISQVTSTVSGYVHPNTVIYSLGSPADCPSGEVCIIRQDNGVNNVVATNIANLGMTFTYIMDDSTNTEVNQIPFPPSYPNATDVTKIKEVRVTVTGQTVTTVALSGGQAKQRQMTSMIKLRNR